MTILGGITEGIAGVRRFFAPPPPPSENISPIDYAKGLLRIHAESEAEKKWRTRPCKKEPWTVAWLERCLKPGDCLFDVGANVGAFSLIASEIVGETGKVVGFEPGFTNFARLCQNIHLNAKEKVIYAVPLALTDRTGMFDFHYKDLTPGQSRHVLGPVSETVSPGTTQRLFGISLDDFLEMFPVPRPHLIKLDVDGAELRVLEGARRTLTSGSVRSCLVEVDLDNTEQVLRALSEMGYRLVAEYRRKPSSPVWYGEFQLGRT